MIIVRRPWRDIPDGALIVGPSGRIWRLVCKFDDQHGRACVDLTDPDDGVTNSQPCVDVNAEIETIVTDSTLERAVDLLSRSFAMQRM